MVFNVPDSFPIIFSSVHMCITNKLLPEPYIFLQLSLGVCKNKQIKKIWFVKCILIFKKNLTVM